MTLDDQLDSRIALYERRTAPLFNFLREHRPLRKEQFACLRSNYFYRISTTPAFIGRLICHALERGDGPTAREALGENLLDELGDLARGPAHLALLTYCFNHIGRLRFGLAPMELVDTEQANDLLPSVRAFREVLNTIARSSDYSQMLGASYAQERVAYRTLDELHRSVVTPLLPQRWPHHRLPLNQYFIVHLKDDAQARELVHERLARDALRRESNTPAAVGSALEGVERFLAAQEALFAELLDALSRMRAGRPTSAT